MSGWVAVAALTVASCRQWVEHFWISCSRRLEPIADADSFYSPFSEPASHQDKNRKKSLRKAAQGCRIVFRIRLSTRWRSLSGLQVDVRSFCPRRNPVDVVKLKDNIGFTPRNMVHRQQGHLLTSKTVLFILFAKSAQMRVNPAGGIFEDILKTAETQKDRAKQSSHDTALQTKTKSNWSVFLITSNCSKQWGKFMNRTLENFVPPESK